MDNIITIYLIRHARQSSPLCNVNVELSKEGILQSQLLGKRLKKYHIDKVYSSNLIRAVMTADIVRSKMADATNPVQSVTAPAANNTVSDGSVTSERNLENIHTQHTGTPLAYELDELRETDFGELTGLPDSVLRVKYADYYAARDLKTEDLRIPGGENGEEVYIRMNRAITTIVEEAIQNEDKNIVVISHGGAIRCYLAGILGMPQSHRFTIAKNMENTAITELRYHIDSKIYSVERINDYSHLEGHDELLRKHFKEQGMKNQYKINEIN